MVRQSVGWSVVRLFGRSVGQSVSWLVSYLDSYTDKHDDWNLVFAHHEEEDEIYPLTLTKIADAQHKDRELKVYFKKNAKMPQKDMGLHLIEDTKVLCRNGKYMIPTILRRRAVSWYHHYLQHPGHPRLEVFKFFGWI